MRNRRRNKLIVGAVLCACALPVHAQDYEWDSWGPSTFDDFHVPQLRRVTTVALDPGHGGRDIGVVGNNLKEKDLTLEIAEETSDRIVRELGARVVLTREDDSHVEETERTAIANHARADVLISIHASASPSEESRGITIYYHSPDIRGRSLDASTASAAGLTAVQWADAGVGSLSGSAQLAGTLASTLANTGLPLAGIQGAPVAPLRGATMPAVLIEVGYLSNTQDAAALADERVRVLIADAIRQAILDYDSALERDQ